MKKEIEQILNQVLNRAISTDEAIYEILRLFEVNPYLLKQHKKGCKSGFNDVKIYESNFEWSRKQLNGG